MGKLHHILLLRIKSAGKTIFLYKVRNKIEMDVTCLTKISTNGDSQPDSMLFSMKVDLGQNVRLVVSLWRYVVSL